jgi:hypothetical protein
VRAAPSPSGLGGRAFETASSGSWAWSATRSPASGERPAQRIVVRIRLRSLHPQEVEAHLTFRLEREGRTAALFLPDAVEALAKAARGVPRLVDRVAEQSLLLAYRGKRKEIDADLVMDAVEEVDP